MSNFSWLMLGKMCRKRSGLQNVEQLTAQICSAEGVIRYATIFLSQRKHPGSSPLPAEKNAMRRKEEKDVIVTQKQGDSGINPPWKHPATTRRAFRSCRRVRNKKTFARSTCLNADIASGNEKVCWIDANLACSVQRWSQSLRCDNASTYVLF